MKQQRCPNCDASNSVPATGLRMRCEYCGFERDVPDVERRRKRMQKEEARLQREAAQQARLEEEQRRKEEERRRGRRKRIGQYVWGKISALISLAFFLGIAGVVLYKVGLLEPLVGESGEKVAKQHVALLKKAGYTIVKEPTVERLVPPLRPFGKTFLDLKADRCVALVLSAGQRIQTIDFGERILRPNRTSFVLLSCPNEPRSLPLKVRLHEAGILTWAVAETAAGVRELGNVAAYPKGCLLRDLPGKRSLHVGDALPGRLYPVKSRKGRWAELVLEGGKTAWAGCLSTL